MDEQTYINHCKQNLEREYAWAKQALEGFPFEIDFYELAPIKEMFVQVATASGVRRGDVEGFGWRSYILSVCTNLKFVLTQKMQAEIDGIGPAWADDIASKMMVALVADKDLNEVIVSDPEKLLLEHNHPKVRGPRAKEIRAVREWWVKSLEERRVGAVGALVEIGTERGAG